MAGHLSSYIFYLLSYIMQPWWADLGMNQHVNNVRYIGCILEVRDKFSLSCASLLIAETHKISSWFVVKYDTFQKLFWFNLILFVNTPWRLPNAFCCQAFLTWCQPVRWWTALWRPKGTKNLRNAHTACTWMICLYTQKVCKGGGDKKSTGKWSKAEKTKKASCACFVGTFFLSLSFLLYPL